MVNCVNHYGKIILGKILNKVIENVLFIHRNQFKNENTI